jgi:hypothetical protein
MQLNGYDLVDRYNRPSVNSSVAIRTFFLNDGQYYDPYDVSACTIFSKLSNDTPNSVIDPATNLIKESQDIGTILMNFEVSGDPIGGFPHDGADGRNTLANLDWVHPSLYVPQTVASGIYRNGVGDYVAVLDGVFASDLSGQYNLHYAFQEGVTIQNKASSVQEYIDIWTVKTSSDSDYQSFINIFRLYDDTFISIAEPLIITTHNRLVNKHLQLGSIVDLKITTDFTVQNKNIDQSILNIFKDYSINNAKVKIQKVNEDTTNLPGRTLIIDFTNVNQITSDNTMLYKFDTTALSAVLTGAGVGGPHGTYIVTASYTVLNQTFVTPPFYFEVS